MADELIKLFPNHCTFVEGFGGAGHIMFHKNPSKVDIYNDIHKTLTSFFRLIREENEELIRGITLTPYSRSQFYENRDSWQTETDEIEKVRQFYCSIMQSIGCIGSQWSFSIGISRRGMSQAVSRWLGNIDENLPDIIERLRSIQIENLDIIELIDKYDAEETLFYLDPPYISNTRVSQNVYNYEMPNEKHIELVSKLINIRGKVVLSGYDHEIYNPLELAGWEKHHLGDYAKRWKSSEMNKGSEYVWINFKKGQRRLF